MRAGFPVVLVLLLAGCGPLQADKVEQAVRQTILREVPGAGEFDVSCPEDIEPVAGTVFDCKVTGAITATATATVQTDDGDVTFEIVPAGKKDAK